MSTATEVSKSDSIQDEITILTCTEGLRANKQFVKREDGSILKKDFSAGSRFDLHVQKVANIEQLSGWLSELEKIPQALVIRGEPLLDALALKTVQRRKTVFATPKQGRRWVLIDIDKIVLPHGLSLKNDSDGVRRYLISLLPPEFQDASYHWQLSSSAGMTTSDKVSMHLWFWLADAVSDAELKRWAKSVNAKLGFKLIDEALFNDVQAHYTAVPSFEGIADPFPTRSGLHRGANDSVQIQLPEKDQSLSTKRQVGLSGSGLTQAKGFEATLDEIGDHPGGHGFHAPIIRSAASYVSTHGAEGTDREALFEKIRSRVLTAHRSSQHEDDAYIERMASRDHIMQAIDTALSKFGQSNRTRQRGRSHKGLQPYFTAKPINANSASEKLVKAITRILG